MALAAPLLPSLPPARGSLRRESNTGLEPIRAPSTGFLVRLCLRPVPALRCKSIAAAAAAAFLRCSASSISRLARSSNLDAIVANASTSGPFPSEETGRNEVDEEQEVEARHPEISFITKLAIAVGIALTITFVSACLKGQSRSSFRLPILGSPSQSVSSVSPVGYTFTFFGNKIIIPEYTPGWVYFWLLMAAGCGLFISEEALNVWVGISLARNLCLGGNWQSFLESFSRNGPYIASTVLWVYWGVCISDMIPFYLGKLFRQTKASEDISAKMGISKDKASKIMRIVKKYGNLIGFVERFSVGARNPTAFLAGALGISPECFFTGVCCGGLITLPIQMGVGFLLRERPMMALAGVATAVGIWTVFPYLIAASTAMFFYLRQCGSNQ